MPTHPLCRVPNGAISIFTALSLGLGLGAVTGVRHLLAPATALEIHEDAGLRNKPLAPDPPRQAINKGAVIPHESGAVLFPKADFEVTGLVLSAARYRFDENAAIAPVDLALGWGAMSVPAIVESFRITQSGRFYYWSTDRLPIARRDVVNSSANMHMIPADASVRQILLSVREGDVVTIRGRLVDISNENGTGWMTSMTRTDAGPGACEVILVSSVDIVRLS